MCLTRGESPLGVLAYIKLAQFPCYLWLWSRSLTKCNKGFSHHSKAFWRSRGEQRPSTHKRKEKPQRQKKGGKRQKKKDLDDALFHHEIIIAKNRTLCIFFKPCC